MTSDRHISRVVLAEYRLSGLSAKATAEVDSHLAGCDQCRRQLRIVSGAFGEIARVEAPPQAEVDLASWRRLPRERSDHHSRRSRKSSSQATARASSSHRARASEAIRCSSKAAN